MLPLSDEQAQALSALGTKLASKVGWWGDEESEPSGSVIDVTRDPKGEWGVTVRDAVGVISLAGVQLVVSPKIPQEHFLFLASEAGVVPRIEAHRTEVESKRSLWEVVAHWFVHAAEVLTRGELSRGYRDRADELEQPRGSIQALATAQLYYQGRVAVACEFEEFSEDIALNRVVRAACDLVASSTLLPRTLRHRARSVLTRMSEVGRLQSADLRVVVDRLTHRYVDALSFAKLLLRGGGTKVAHGSTHGWCFLVRTPELIESGIRRILQRALAPTHNVQKRGIVILGSRLTLNPDLVFDRGLAIGDVKYKFLEEDWQRSDLYQSVAFAVGYECSRAIVVGFKQGGGSGPAPLQIGKISVESLAWDAQPGADPRDSATHLVRGVSDFLGKSKQLPELSVKAVAP